MWSHISLEQRLLLTLPHSQSPLLLRYYYSSINDSCYTAVENIYHVHIFCFLGQGREAGRHCIHWPCCDSMHPWTGTSPPSRPIKAAVAASAQSPHGLEQ